jgi:ParB family chromosome partitioning protein
LGSGQNEWHTPPEYVEVVRAVLGAIDLDPASCKVAQRTVKATKFFTITDDGLTKEWHGRVFLNPPYSQPVCRNFVSKLITERHSGRCKAAILLTHNFTDTAWFQKAGALADAICFTRGRIKFVHQHPGNAPIQGQAFFYFGDNVSGFREKFAAFGGLCRWF